MDRFCSCILWDRNFWCPVWELKLVVSLCCNFGSLIVVWPNRFSLLRRQGSITAHVWTVLPIYTSLVCHPVCCPVVIVGTGDWTVSLTTSVHLGTLLGNCGALSPRQTLRAWWQRRLYTCLVVGVVNWRLINCRDTYSCDELYRKWPRPIPKSSHNFILPDFFKTSGT